MKRKYLIISVFLIICIFAASFCNLVFIRNQNRSLNKLSEKVSSQAGIIEKIAASVEEIRKDTDKVDYRWTVPDWYYSCNDTIRQKIGTDICELIDDIIDTEYGTAGSSLKRISAAVSILKLSEKVKNYPTTLDDFFMISPPQSLIFSLFNGR